MTTFGATASSGATAGVRPRYMPILKGKQGELKALAEAAHAPWLSELTPILEVVPWEPDETDHQRNERELLRTANRVIAAWSHTDRRILIDAGAIDPDPEDASDPELQPISPRLYQLLHQAGVRAEPVVRVSDSQGHIRALTATARRFFPAGAAIRVTAEDLDDVVTPLENAVERTADALDIPPRRIDVIMDFGAIQDDNALSLASRLARFVLPQLARREWRNLALAAGAFPANLSDVPPYKLGEFRRRDAALWQTVAQLEIGRPLAFADYAITHPLLPVGNAFPAAPQLRYTVDDFWITLKGRLQDRRGHAQFYDICAELLRAAPRQSAPEESWGDQYIHSAAAKSHDPNLPVTPGNASTWRAIGTSHHMAYVVNKLRRTGAP